MTEQTQTSDSPTDPTSTTPTDYTDYLAWKAQQAQPHAASQSGEEPVYEGYLTKVELQGEVATLYFHAPRVGRTYKYVVDTEDVST